MSGKDHRENIGIDLPFIPDLAPKHCLSRTGNIIKYLSHPHHGLFSRLASGKRFRSLRLRTTRYCKSFCPYCNINLKNYVAHCSSCSHWINTEFMLLFFCAHLFSFEVNSTVSGYICGTFCKSKKCLIILECIFLNVILFYMIFLMLW